MIPIAYKYREGKMKRTLERELKGTEIVEREVERFDFKMGVSFSYTFRSMGYVSNIHVCIRRDSYVEL